MAAAKCLGPASNKSLLLLFFRKEGLFLTSRLEKPADIIGQPIICPDNLTTPFEHDRRIKVKSIGVSFAVAKRTHPVQESKRLL